jgi:hypothetical protein
MFRWLRRSEPIQKVLVVRAHELQVEDRLVFNMDVEEVVAIHCGAEFAHVILRPVHPEAVTLDEYHEEELYLDLLIQITSFK